MGSLEGHLGGLCGDLCVLEGDLVGLECHLGGLDGHLGSLDGALGGLGGLRVIWEAKCEYYPSNIDDSGESGLEKSALGHFIKSPGRGYGEGWGRGFSP